MNSNKILMYLFGAILILWMSPYIIRLLISVLFTALAIGWHLLWMVIIVCVVILFVVKKVRP
jgi:hypothetical protein